MDNSLIEKILQSYPSIGVEKDVYSESNIIEYDISSNTDPICRFNIKFSLIDDKYYIIDISQFTTTILSISSGNINDCIFPLLKVLRTYVYIYDISKEEYEPNMVYTFMKYFKLFKSHNELTFLEINNVINKYCIKLYEHYGRFISTAHVIMIDNETKKLDIITHGNNLNYFYINNYPEKMIEHNIFNILFKLSVSGEEL